VNQPALPAPTTEAGEAGLAALLDRPREAVLAFDYDGVLSPIVDDPAQARPYDRSMAALSRLAVHVGAIAVITGRPAEVVATLGGFIDLPELGELVVFGHYGRERWDATSRTVTAPPESSGVIAARAELAPLLSGLGIADATIEDKGSSLAVHTRRSADPHGTLDRLSAPLADFAAHHGLMVEPGRLVIELRPPGVDKGTALRVLVAERNASVVTYAGDDLGDLTAFAAVEALRDENVAGLKICSGSAEAAPEVAKRADLVVDGPEGMADFLEALLEALTNHSPYR
jgi:trehalose 6-phosphate phosphatase